MSAGDPADAPAVLASCLERVARGEPVDDVLAGVPDDRAAVRALVRTALLARSARHVPDPAFRDRLGALLRTAELDPEPTPPRDAASDAPRWRRATLRLLGATTAVALALGVLATGAGASPAALAAELRRASREVLLGWMAIERVVAPMRFERTVPDAPRIRPAIRLPDPAARADDRAVGAGGAAEGAQAPEPRQALGLAAPTLAAPAEPSEPRPSPSALAELDDPASKPAPTAARIAAAIDAAPVDPMAATVEPAAPAVVIVGGEAATAIASPPAADPEPAPAPVIAPAPPAVIGGGGIAGTVTFVDETAFPGALVTAYPLDRRGDVMWPWGVSARTEADGSYRIVRLFAGRYKVAVGERGPWVYRRWYLDTRSEHEAEPIEVRSGRFVEGIDVRTRVWPLGVIVVDPDLALRWIRWY